MEKRLAVATVDRVYGHVSYICKLAAAAAHGSLQTDCKNVRKSYIGLSNVFQVRRTIVKRLLTDVDDEIAAKVGLQTIGVKRSKTEL